MSGWIPAHGASIRLVAKPDRLHSAAGTTGNLVIEYKNRSFVPLTLSILRLDSADQHVATPSFASNPPLQINVPRRPYKYTALWPYSSSSVVGTWAPTGPGYTSVDANVDVRDQHLASFSVIYPTDDVKVT